jgi:RimJ/RimL family protein N-acetyltransferase
LRNLSAVLSLAPATEDDLPFLSELAADPEVEPFLAFGAAEDERLRALLHAPGPAPDSTALLRIESDHGEALGALALSLVNPRSRICDISRVMIRPDRRRSGIAGAAIELACAHALLDQGMHRVQTECYGDNRAAHRLFERVGFTREGIRRRAYWRRGGWLDGVMFGLLAEEFSVEGPQAGAGGASVTPRISSAPIPRK